LEIIFQKETTENYKRMLKLNQLPTGGGSGVVVVVVIVVVVVVVVGAGRLVLVHATEQPSSSSPSGQLTIPSH
jgi:hypothetical protein